MRKKPSEDSFYFLMGLAYRQLDKPAEADEALQNAQHYAEVNEKENDYHGKLELLKSLAE